MNTGAFNHKERVSQHIKQSFTNIFNFVETYKHLVFRDKNYASNINVFDKNGLESMKKIAVETKWRDSIKSAFDKCRGDGIAVNDFRTGSIIICDVYKEYLNILVVCYFNPPFRKSLVEVQEIVDLILEICSETIN